ncbi:hypothetical protein CHLRE_17g709450v5 [Chlamydomonas reinhardtii]|uniref:Uncharacterized protein n=1 Tax=Chlamydomonas reinhardtii TaxID=3055 RepID=A8IR61_CHLRE|nr:uncharacterized protein CHLRE_17g709450v5 [Chlamydomonas reinhardtii]PNW70186.1 hypothetical protein CHLRE_17g709450v5 [Chlamydomonas reinhardtii]|eukprot:XP_001691538.1 hypothetical protein CHLREDRAFT_156769 [Chlamydomonas reinhardtii]
MVCPMRFVLVAISAVLALTAVVLSNRPEGEPGSASSKTREEQQAERARSWKDGMYFIRDAFTGKYIYTQLVRYRGGARAA